MALAAGSVASAGADEIADRWLPERSIAQAAVSPIEAGSEHLEVVTITAENSIANGTVEHADTSAKVGTRRVVQAGAPGVEMVSYTVTTINGIEVGRIPGISVMVSPPVDEIVAVGALTIPAATDVEKGSNRELGKQLASDLYGWTGDEWSCLDALFARESGWSHTAENRSSSDLCRRFTRPPAAGAMRWQCCWPDPVE
jgi:hypothetical protein